MGRFQRLDKEAAKKAVAKYAEQPLQDYREVAPTTLKEYERCMKMWKEFCHEMNEMDPDQVWFDLCLNIDSAKKHILAFFQFYVTLSDKTFPMVGGDEHRNTVTRVKSLIIIWRYLIAAADRFVLHNKRLSDPSNKDTWRLKWVDHRQHRQAGAVFEITQWIQTQGAEELGLEDTPLYPRIEVAAEDIVTIVTAVWERPDIVSCPPVTRMAFLSMLLLASIGGFRPKALDDFRYNQIQVSIVRDPQDRNKKKIAVTFSVPIVKKLKSRLSAGRSHIQFTVTMVPLPTICVASLVTALAIHDNAFDPSITSVETLLRRPDLGKSDYLPLKWRDDIKDKRIFPVRYRTYSNLWKQACLAAGLRHETRLYAIRVGTGMDLDGTLSDVLRNYVMSNTSAVFEKSYQADHIRKDLLKVRYQDIFPGTMWDSLTERAMRTLTLRRDVDAPSSPSGEDLESFELREDVINFRKEIQNESDNTKRYTIQKQLKRRLAILSRQAVHARRGQFFAERDRQRALGQSISGETASNGALTGPTSGVAQLIRDFSIQEQDHESQWQEQWLVALHRYLSGHNPPLRQTPQGLNGMECPFCEGRFNKEAFSQHVTQTHLDHGCRSTVFLSTFMCSCKERIQNCSEWNRHVHLKHADAVEVLSVVHVCGKSECLLCSSLYARRCELGRHFNSAHTQERTFHTPFHCPRCPKGVVIESITSWNRHLEEAHDPLVSQHGGANNPAYKRQCTLCDKQIDLRGSQKHFNAHNNDLVFPVPCTMCLKEGSTITLGGWPDWRAHVWDSHRRDVPTMWLALSEKSQGTDSPTTTGKREEFVDIDELLPTQRAQVALEPTRDTFLNKVGQKRGRSPERQESMARKRKVVECTK